MQCTLAFSIWKKMSPKIGRVNGASTWWALRGSSKRLWHVHSRGETRWQGDEQAVKIPEWLCLVCGADGFLGQWKNGLLQCKNQINFCLELGYFGGRWGGGLLSDIAAVSRSREAHNSQEKRHLLKQRLYTEQTGGSKPDREYCKVVKQRNECSCSSTLLWNGRSLRGQLLVVG